MSLLYLAKVPACVLMLIASEAGLHPPRRDAPKEADRGTYGRPDFLARAAGWLPALGGVIRTLCFLAETAAVVARQYPSPLSTRILSTLFKDPSAVDALAITPTFVLGFLLVVLGGAIRKYCYMTLGKYFTFQLAVFKDHQLVTTGPYAVVRHPAYTGLTMAMMGLVLVQLLPGSYVWESGMLDTPGLAFLWGLWGIVLAATPVIAIRRIPKEDAVMQKEFGMKWKEWARRTPYKLIPYVY